MLVLSYSSILSNSSIQHTPISANTKAPPSKHISLEIGSLITAAVSPTPEDPLPVVYTPLGDITEICFNIYDLATPGSPYYIIYYNQSNIDVSSNFHAIMHFSNRSAHYLYYIKPINNNNAFLTSFKPNISGAKELASILYKSPKFVFYLI